MHIVDLAEALGLETEDVQRIARVCAEQSDVYQALKHRVHIRQASGRDCDDEGVHAADPAEGLKVKYLMPYGGRQQGEVVELPYSEAVALLNSGPPRVVQQVD